jgi:hypothetical protein
MVALAGAPTVEKRFDASGPTWTLEDLDGAVGSYFAERDPQPASPPRSSTRCPEQKEGLSPSVSKNTLM